MELPVPIFQKDTIYNLVDVTEPSAGTLTRAYEAVERKNVYKAMYEFLSGSIVSMTSVDNEVVEDKTEIRKLCGLMPYMSAEAVALKVMTMVNEDDTVEGMYSCPRCHMKIITEGDSADRISNIETVCMPKKEYESSIMLELSKPVEIKNAHTGEVVETVKNFEMRYPTINDCIPASQNMREGQEVRVQFKIYLNAVTKINGVEANSAWKGKYGDLMFMMMAPRDITLIGKAMTEYGLKKTIERECYECGKVWQSPLNTSNFFVSGLQPT